MIRVMVVSAGDPAGINFCNSLKLCEGKYWVIGVDTNVYRLHMATADIRYRLPPSDQAEYWPALLQLVRTSKPDIVYAADTNRELELISERREEIGVPVFLPSREAIAIYENKWLSYEYFSRAGLSVPDTILINEPKDIDLAISEFGEIWLRAIRGSGGKASLPTKDSFLAKSWINRHNGWGAFTAAEVLTQKMSTWTGLWKQGELAVCQARNRLHWEYAALAPSGVTGITGAQTTTSDRQVHDVALAAISAIPYVPNAIVSVDMTYDNKGRPNPTEIQASRFFSSIFFLAKAGLNLPDMFVQLGLTGQMPALSLRNHPLPDGLVWLKSIDCLPLLTTLDVIREHDKHWCVDIAQNQSQ